MSILLKYGAFFLLYILGSRAVFIPAGIAMGMGKYTVLFLVFCLDIVQIPLYYYFYEKGTSKVKFLNFIYRLPKREKVESSRIMKFARSLGSFGVVLIAAMPAFGGGMWTSVLMAHLLHLRKRRSVFLLALGSFLGCLLVVYGFEGFLYLFGLAKK